MSEYPTHLIRRIRHKAFGTEERFVLMVIADHMSKTTDRAWPSVATIALITDYNERTVRRVITWLLSVGALVEFEDGRASRTFGINFDLLANLPAALEPRAGKRALVPGDRTPVPADRTLVLVALDRTLVPPPLSPSPDDRALVPGGAGTGTGECISEGTMKESVKEPFSATVPARVDGSSGQRLAFFFANPDPSTPATIPAPLVARPEPSKASSESLPVNASNAPPKGKGKAGKKPVRKFTDEQLAARDVVYAFWKKTYLDELGVEPIVGNVEVGQMVQLLKKVQWNSATACALIKNAFADVFFRERIKTIGYITANPSTYQQTPTVRPNLSTSQMPTGKKDYGC